MENTSHTFVEARPTDYWISPTALYIQRNAAGNNDFVHANCASGAVVVFYMRGVVDFDASRNYRRWPLIASPTVFHDSDRRYVYVAIPRSNAADAIAQVVFPSEEIDVYGRNREGELACPTEDDPTNPGQQRSTHFYINTQGILSSSGVGSQTPREWEHEIVYGNAGTDEAVITGGSDTWWRQDQASGIVTFLKQIVARATTENPDAGFWDIDVANNLRLGNTTRPASLDFNNHSVTGIAEDATPVTATDRLVTPYYANRNFLNKLAEDVAKEMIRFEKGVTFGRDDTNRIDANGEAHLQSITSREVSKFNNGFVIGSAFASMLTGGRVDGEANAELNSLRLREFLEVPELRYNRTSIETGTSWRAPGGGLIDHVEQLTDETGVIYLHLEEGEIGMVAEDDICQGIFHSVDPADNATTDNDDGCGYMEYAGFCTAFFAVTMVEDWTDTDEYGATTTYPNGKVTYRLRSTVEGAHSLTHPTAMMNFVSYGNFTDTSRQKSVYATRAYERYLYNVNNWTFDASNIAMQLGDLSNLHIAGEPDMSGYSAYLNNIYMSGTIQQIKNLPVRLVVDCPDTFLSDGESVTVTLSLTNGLEDLTHNVTSWRATRSTGNTLTDGVWNMEAEHNFSDNQFTISPTDLAEGRDAPTLFTFTATYSNNETRQATLVMRHAPVDGKKPQTIYLRSTCWENQQSSPSNPFGATWPSVKADDTELWSSSMNHNGLFVFQINRQTLQLKEYRSFRLYLWKYGTGEYSANPEHSPEAVISYLNSIDNDVFVAVVTCDAIYWAQEVLDALQLVGCRKLDVADFSARTSFALLGYRGLQTGRAYAVVSDYMNYTNKYECPPTEFSIYVADGTFASPKDGESGDKGADGKDGKDGKDGTSLSLNLLDQTAFNGAHDKWTIFTGTVDTTDTVNDCKSLAVINTHESNTVDFLRQTIWESNGVHRIEEGRWYTFSYWVKGSGKLTTFIYPNSTKNIYVGAFDGADKAMGSDGACGINALTDEWTRHSITIFTDFGDTTSSKSFMFRLGANSSCKIACPKLELANETRLGTSWTPSTFDITGISPTLYEIVPSTASVVVNTQGVVNPSSDVTLTIYRQQGSEREDVTASLNSTPEQPKLYRRALSGGTWQQVADATAGFRPADFASGVEFKLTANDVNVVYASVAIPVVYDATAEPSRFTSFVFCRSNKAISATITGGTYTSPRPTNYTEMLSFGEKPSGIRLSDWRDGIPAGTAPIWVASCTFSSDVTYKDSDLATGVLASWDGPRLLASNSEVQIRYSSNEDVSDTNPETDTSVWSVTPSESTIWMAIREKNALTWGDWKINRIKGEKGEDGVGFVFNLLNDTAFSESLDNTNGYWKHNGYSDYCTIVGGLYNNKAIFVDATSISDSNGVFAPLYAQNPYAQSTSYVLSFYVKGSGTILTGHSGATEMAQQQVYVDGTPRVINRTLSCSFALTDEWQRHYIAFTTIELLPMSTRLFFRATQGSDAYISCVKLEVDSGNHLATPWTPSTTDIQGKSGLDGAVYRTSDWQLGKEYLDGTTYTGNIRFIDVCFDDNNSAYICKRTHTSDASKTLSNATYWEPMSNTAPIHTKLILADNAKITFGQMNQLLVQGRDNGVKAGLCGTNDADKPVLFAGSNVENTSTAPFRVYEDGRMVASNGEFNGKIVCRGVSGNKISSFNEFGNGAFIQYYPNSEVKCMEFGGGVIRYYNPDGSTKWVIGASGTADMTMDFVVINAIMIGNNYYNDNDSYNPDRLLFTHVLYKAICRLDIAVDSPDYDMNGKYVEARADGSRPDSIADARNMLVDGTMTDSDYFVPIKQHPNHVNGKKYLYNLNMGVEEYRLYITGYLPYYNFNNGVKDAEAGYIYQIQGSTPHTYEYIRDIDIRNYAIDENNYGVRS